jgi:hypothetical protein
MGCIELQENRQQPAFFRAGCFIVIVQLDGKIVRKSWKTSRKKLWPICFSMKWITVAMKNQDKLK